MPALGDVGEGDHHALDRPVFCAVRQDTADEPVSVTGFDFALDRHLRLEDRSRIAKQRLVFGEGVQISQRSPDIARDNAEQRLGGGRKKPDVEFEVEENGCQISAVEHVLQIVGRGALPLQRFLQLAVQRGQFLVKRLQLFFRGDQLLIGRLVFFVDRQGLFVDGLVVLARGFEVMQGVLQIGLGGLQLTFELADFLCAIAGCPGRQRRCVFQQSTPDNSRCPRG